MTSLEDIMAEPRVAPLCDDLGLSEQATELAERYAREADEGTHLNKEPDVVAASAIYAAALLCNEKRTQAQVGEAADVSCVAIRQTYPVIVEHDGYTLKHRPERADSQKDDDSQTRPSLFKQAKAMLTGGDAA